MGILPMPAQGQSLEDVYNQTSAYSELVPVWGRPTPFYDLAEELSGFWGQTFVNQYIRGNSMIPLVHLSFIGTGMTLNSSSDIVGATLSNMNWRESYKQAALDVVKASQPLYLSLGNEVNRWYEKYGTDEENPNGFQHYISLYEEIYDLIKELSPKTKIFCTFAREIVSENREANLDIIDMFNPDKIDILVITSYPHSIHGINRPSDIPDDYYSTLLSYMPDKPFGFSELAWPSMSAFGGEQGQADFLSEIAERLTVEQGIDLHLLAWSWLHDLTEEDSTGLIRRDGVKKLAYGSWRSLSLLGHWRTRQRTIPSDVNKITPETDLFPPILHSDEYEEPIPMSNLINTAGAEDSPFILPDGKTLYFFFTPDVRVPVEKQILDQVTGIYLSKKIDRGSWNKPERVILNEGVSLDGCTFVQEEIIWFCTVREGYTGIHWFTAELVDGQWQNWKYAGDIFPTSFEVGELHITKDGKEVYFHSSRQGGKGNYDIWVTKRIDSEWSEPENIEIVNTSNTEGWPFISQDGSELWFNRNYLGTPAIFRSKKVNDAWSKPELIISQFAGEPSLDNEGNIYFVHHFYKNGVMLEADIYVARSK
jgi:hypothetical protein